MKNPREADGRLLRINAPNIFCLDVIWTELSSDIFGVVISCCTCPLTELDLFIFIFQKILVSSVENYISIYFCSSWHAYFLIADGPWSAKTVEWRVWHLADNLTLWMWANGLRRNRMLVVRRYKICCSDAFKMHLDLISCMSIHNPTKQPNTSIYSSVHPPTHAYRKTEVRRNFGFPPVPWSSHSMVQSKNKTECFKKIFRISQTRAYGKKMELSFLTEEGK